MSTQPTLAEMIAAADPSLIGDQSPILVRGGTGYAIQGASSTNPDTGQVTTQQLYYDYPSGAWVDATNGKKLNLGGLDQYNLALQVAQDPTQGIQSKDNSLNYNVAHGLTTSASQLATQVPEWAKADAHTNAPGILDQVLGALPYVGAGMIMGPAIGAAAGAGAGALGAGAGTAMGADAYGLSMGAGTVGAGAEGAGALAAGTGAATGAGLDLSGAGSGITDTQLAAPGLSAADATTAAQTAVSGVSGSSPTLTAIQNYLAQQFTPQQLLTTAGKAALQQELSSLIQTGQLSPLDAKSIATNMLTNVAGGAAGTAINSATGLPMTYAKPLGTLAANTVKNGSLNQNAVVNTAAGAGLDATGLGSLKPLVPVVTQIAQGKPVNPQSTLANVALSQAPKVLSWPS